MTELTCPVCWSPVDVPDPTDLPDLKCKNCAGELHVVFIEQDSRFKLRVGSSMDASAPLESVVTCSLQNR
jgi:hypothetical protein